MKGLFMNGGPLNVIIVIFVLAIILYVTIFALQKIVVKQVKELQTKKQKLIQLDIKADLLDGKKLSLTGKSLKEFDDLQKEYKQIENVDFKAFDQKADDVLFEAKGWNVLRSKQSYKELNDLLDSIASHVVEVRTGIEKLEKMDAEHKVAVKELEGEYQELRKILLTKNFEFGEAIDKLEDMLSSLEDDFDEFTHLTEQGDHTAASDIHVQLNAQTAELKQYIEEIPELQKQIKKDFPAQIDELKAAFNQLSEDGYRFPNEMLDKDIIQLDTDTNNAGKLISNLEIFQAKTDVKYISNQIDDLYAQFQIEMDAKKEVIPKIKEVENFINHARQQNHLLMIELDRIGQRYILTDKQETKTQGFAEKIKEIENEYRQVVLDIQFNKAIYSIINREFISYENQLTSIEENQQDIWEGLQELFTQENNAQSRLEKAAFALRDVKREVEQWNLPGLPDSYKKMYRNLNNQIDRLDRVFQTSHINMLDINGQLAIIEKDIDNLNNATKIIYQDARISEQLFQYANKYRMKDQVVSVAYQEALEEYQNYFNFDNSKNILGKALEKVEPGIYEKINSQL